VKVVSNRGKVFYNRGTPLVLGVLVDVTPSSHTMSANPREGRSRTKQGGKTKRKSA
jgi:hypothetical protein